MPHSEAHKHYLVSIFDLALQYEMLQRIRLTRHHLALV
ncbi:hypothetical protein HDF16_003560 [Granulicella aggregans]|uniref:Uncharacterized protein n=1 Tax=Granulicella aggregans TaxID=474949 RepID=A0A7W7ZFF9_9BACT|nr:hypothetical protein [Granulicella aggregans]